MEILPAIDLRGGEVVRLVQGDYSAQTTYATDPAEIARKLTAAGARWIHIVDLDAGQDGPAHKHRQRPGGTPATEARIELGGGARDRDTILAMLDIGVERVVVGSAATKDWRWFEGLLSEPELAGRLALGLDARDGKLAAAGWTEQTEVKATDLAGRTRGSDLSAIVYTDIARDGMLAGVNVEATEEMIAATDVPIIASGGVRSVADVRRCREIGCGGVIIGKAWYEGRIDLAEAILAAGP